MGRVMAKKRLAILISGRGSNMMALVAAAHAANYPAEVAAIISNRPDAAGLAWARAEGLPVTLIDHKAYPSREAFDAALDQVLVAADVELIALAGFMRIQSATFVRKWQGRQLNIHPSLLPAFKGLNPHAQALQAGVKISGCTVHFVSEELDGGPIIAQTAVPVCEGDSAESLAARILVAEHALYPEALALVATGRTRLNEGRVLVLPAGSTAAARPAQP
jgi:phosphoribosylglycinamide formyltransferase-1